MARLIQTADLTPEILKTMDSFDLEAVYNGLDCCVTLEVLEQIKPQLDNTTGATYDFSRALQAPVLEMSMTGLLVDEEQRQAVKQGYIEKIKKVSDQLTRLVTEGIGVDLNWRSPVQLKSLLYDVMGLPPVRKRNAQGKMAPTVNREALERLSGYFWAEPICAHLLVLRDLDKKRSFLETGIDPDNRMRANFNIAGTSTGRLSSSMSDFGTGTNMQNIDRDLRSVFIADPGMKFANLDLEQADARNVGAICWNLFVESRGEEFAGAYLDACESGDLHTTVCRMAWTNLNWPEDKSGWRAVADETAYRNLSYRDLAKKLGHGCLTADHEVLTPEGWVPISDKPEVIMAWEPVSGTMRWERPSHWEDKPWQGELFHITGYNTDMLATNDHRMPVFTRKGGFKELPAELLHTVPGYDLKQFGVYVGGSSTVTPEQARLVAAAQADGHVYPNGSVRWGFSKQRKKDRLQQLLQNRQAKITDYHVRGETYYHLPKDQVDFPAVKQAGPWMLEWSREALQAWVDELKFWDGTQQKTFTWVYGKDRIHMEWMRTLCILSGQGASYRDNGRHNCASVGLNNRKNRRISSLTIQSQLGEGRRVYCPTVPSSGFLVRRNGKVMFSLNTNYYGTPPTMAKHTKVAKSLIESFQDAYFQAFQAIPEWHKRVAGELKDFGSLTTLFGRRRHFFGRYNDDATLREAIAYSPQSMTADEIDIGIVKLWRANRVQLLLQVHDSILIQYPEELEDEIVPWALEQLTTEIELEGGRKFSVPTEAKVGWNYGDYSPSNPGGLMKWKGGDDRKREKKFRTFRGR